jgi:MEMO1 family protein
MARRPAVAGVFYETDQTLIAAQIERSFLGNFGPKKLPIPRHESLGQVLGLVCPHAGYSYSGGAAANSFYALASDGIPEVLVIMGPNHHGISSKIAVSVEERWITPMGVIHTDIELAEQIVSKSKYAVEDEDAHIKEHSIEVQLPFIQYLFGSHTKIVPIVISHVGLGDSVDLMYDLAQAICQSIDGKKAVIIASTDFTHYETQEITKVKDHLALDQIENLDGEGLINVVFENDITMCGVNGTAVMLEACKIMGANQAELLSYFTSGDVTGDYKHVVGYASVAIKALPRDV